ncbi:DUF397 domain-containing protein [Streptomyces sp. NBC_00536]|uniref:DUF397 domain-containing protein n=1 Tax=Streptomyces sp. NBC_00536 TaxID=2975769 RepID=UPI002E814D67|nr:DUF397 domain-containing protein [Streptomyces sp. NBC_00536]WUC80960.1 DUF397 domain-containing protein [Streptomyces sp. NBC_00536]
MSATQWIKSSYSSPEGGNCLEWSPRSVSGTGIVPVRDSKRPAGPVLEITDIGWGLFVDHIKQA